MVHSESETRRGDCISRRTGLAALASSLCAAPAFSQGADGYPSKPIRIIVPFNSGGTNDVLARVIGQKFTEYWGQPTVIENRPGSAGWLGVAAMAHMPADGYAIAVTISNIIYARSLYATLPFDMEKDFAPVSMISRSPVLLVVLPTFPANDVKGFVEHVRANPGKHSYASFGQGTTAHIFGETLKLENRIDMVHVAYKGASPAVIDLLAGRVSCAFLDTATVLPLLQAGKIKVIAMSGTQRLGSAPTLPTFLEQGYKGFEPVGFFLVLAPAGTPPDVVNKLSAGVAKAVNSPDLKRRIVDMGQDAVGSTPQALADAIRNDAAVFDRTIRQSNIRIEQS